MGSRGLSALGGVWGSAPTLLACMGSSFPQRGMNPVTSKRKDPQRMRRRLLLTLPLLFGMAGSAAAADLVLKRAMLSSGGVGYFEYEAEVDGAATLGLDLPLDQVDDVLKSLVVYDSAGSVGGIELPGRDTTHAAFADVPIGPEALDSPVDYLNGLRGVLVQVSGQ